MTENKEKNTYECPDCGDDLEKTLSCGAESYYCYTCSKLISRKRIKGHPKYKEENGEK
jgi:ribosomal protein L37AE/L43A